MTVKGYAYERRKSRNREFARLLKRRRRRANQRDIRQRSKSIGFDEQYDAPIARRVRGMGRDVAKYWAIDR